MDLYREPSLRALVTRAERVLLVNGPAVDIRLPWPQWRQPTGLLRLGAALRQHGCDVRLIDCLSVRGTEPLRRERLSREDVDGQRVDVWRFGLSPMQVLAQLTAWDLTGWQPDSILVSCGLGHWWKGSHELIIHLRKNGYSGTRIVLGGVYATFYPDHAMKYVDADELVIGDVVEATSASSDLSVYQPARLPRFAGINLYDPAGLVIDGGSKKARPDKALVKEISAKASLGVTTFAFFDPWLGPDCREDLIGALKAISATIPSRVGFVAVGNISPRLVDDKVAGLLKQVNFRQLHLHDDLEYSASGVQRQSSYDEYLSCVQALHRAGFRQRRDEIGAGIVVGVPQEDLVEVTERLVRVASVVGSVNLVPFQFAPGAEGEAAALPWLTSLEGEDYPTKMNGHLYPLARLAGATFEDYMELTRLAALLNSKYRSTTFDFLGQSITAMMVRESLRDELWRPRLEGSTKVPSALELVEERE